MSNNLELELKTFQEDDSAEVPPSDIIAYNESRSCADLFRMYKQGILKILPDFQREIVWNGPAQTRFIDSLMKQLPIPSLCFSLDYKVSKWQVIDGLQRMASIIRFLSGDATWVLSDLEDVDPEIRGQPSMKFQDENSSLNLLYKRVENLTLPITVLRCDYTKRPHTRYLFTIFHRLNTGAIKLNNQEIRNCIYSGPLNNLLRDLNETPNWLKLNKLKKAKIKSDWLLFDDEDKKLSGHRFTKQELILRLFAFHDAYETYGGRLARFLNDYMDQNKSISNAALEAKRDLFERTVKVVLEKVYTGLVPAKTPISIVEATLVGVSRNLEYVESASASDVVDMYNEMRAHEEFSDAKLSEGLSGKTRVIDRLNAAVSAFRRP